MRNVYFYGHRGDKVKANNTQTQRLTCGHCGRDAHGRNLARDSESGAVFILCPCGQPTAAIRNERTGDLISQWPGPREFHAGEEWPRNLCQLFDEASAVLAASAPTSAAMICRKVLMVAGHEQGAGEDLRFEEYVDFLADDALKFPQARAAIDRIRDIGNAANHEVEFVDPTEAREALQITHYLLEALYGFAGTGDEENAAD